MYNELAAGLHRSAARKKAKTEHIILQASKVNIKSFDELSDLAKRTLQRVKNGEQKAIRKELESDKELLFAINELIVAGFLTLPPNEEKFK